jgi:hypothetical protein
MSIFMTAPINRNYFQGNTSTINSLNQSFISSQTGGIGAAPTILQSDANQRNIPVRISLWSDAENISLWTRCSMILFFGNMHILQKIAAVFVEFYEFSRLLFGFPPRNDNFIQGEIRCMTRDTHYPLAPVEFIDPFSQQIIFNPVQITKDGITYYFEKFFLQSAISSYPYSENESRVLSPIFGTEQLSKEQFSEAPEFQLRIFNWLRSHEGN